MGEKEHPDALHGMTWENYFLGKGFEFAQVKVHVNPTCDANCWTLAGREFNLLWLVDYCETILGISFITYCWRVE
jgi:hypothetical protein